MNCAVVVRRQVLSLCGWLVLSAVSVAQDLPGPTDLDNDYFAAGDRRGSLKSDAPLPIFDADPNHLWNRLLHAFYTRVSHLPPREGEPAVDCIEGGDWLDFLGWTRTDYWSDEQTCRRLNSLLDEFLAQHGATLIQDPLRRVILVRDLWAAFDFYVGQNIDRLGDRARQQRRTSLARKLARVMQSLAPTAGELAELPDTYQAAIASGRFAKADGGDQRVSYLPATLFTQPDEWVEIDFYQPKLHEDLQNRFITLHTRSYRARSYFRIFYKFPGGRARLAEYLKLVDAQGVDWRFAAQNGFIRLLHDVPQIPVGTEVALVQLLMGLDDQLQPTPTKIVESVELRVFRNVDGSGQPTTNTGIGMNVYDYTFKRRLLFDHLRDGGLHHEPDDFPKFQVLFQGDNAPDWGRKFRSDRVADQCIRCHTGVGTGVFSVVSLYNSGGFDAGAQMGISVPLPADVASPRGGRAARWKCQDETYRRLLEMLDDGSDAGTSAVRER